MVVFWSPDFWSINGRSQQLHKLLSGTSGGASKGGPTLAMGWESSAGMDGWMDGCWLFWFVPTSYIHIYKGWVILPRKKLYPVIGDYTSQFGWRLVFWFLPTNRVKENQIQYTVIQSKIVRWKHRLLFWFVQSSKIASESCWLGDYRAIWEDLFSGAMLDLGRVLGGSCQLISGDRITPIDKTYKEAVWKGNRPT